MGLPIGKRSRDLSGGWRRCDLCPLPAVCYGADLVNPMYRCPRCCRRDHVCNNHGDPDYLNGHEAAEGVVV